MSPVLYLVVMVFTALASVSDLRTRKIPNWLNLSGLIAGLAFHGISGGTTGLKFSLVGFGTGFGILFLLWIMGGGGGGDAKLMGAVGAWLGAPLTLIVFVFSGFLTAIGQACLLVLRPKTGPAPEDSCGENSARKSQKVPYAVPVAIAAWIICGLKLVNS